MNYPPYPPPAPGDYACVRITKLAKTVFGQKVIVPDVIGWLIRVVTRSRYNHAFIYVGYGKIIEAQPEGAELSDLSKYDGCDMVWSYMAAEQPTAAQRAEIVARAWTLVGRPYGFLDIAWLLLASLGFKARWLLRKVENEARLICSQLVSLSGQASHPPFTSWLCGQVNACEVTPGDLERRITDAIA